MKKNKQNLISHPLLSCALISSFLLLVACDTKDTTPLPGKREAFLNFQTNIEADQKLKKTGVVIPAAEVNFSWKQTGGYGDPAFQNLALGKDIKPIWAINVGAESTEDRRILSAPVADDTAVYTLDSVGKVTAVSIQPKQKNEGSENSEMTPEILWQQATSPEDRSDDTLGGGLAVTDGTVFVTTSFGEILALDAKTGKEIWKKSGFSPFRSQPTISEGRIIAQAINNELVVLSAKDGTHLWTHGGIPEAAQLLIGSTPSASNDTVIVAYSSGEVHALNSSTGQILWSDTITPIARVDTVTGIPHICARPLMDQNYVYMISHGGRMTTLDLKSGSRVWQKDLGGINTPVVLGEFVFVLTNKSELVCLDRKTGSVYWVSNLPEEEDSTASYFTGPIMAGSTLVMTSSKGKIIRINPKDGLVVETVDISGRLQLTPIVVNQTLYALTDDAVLHAFR